MRIPDLKLTQFHSHTLINQVYFNTFSDHVVLNHKLINTPHTHDFFLCVLFTSGEGTHEIDFGTYAIRPGAVFFLRPGQSHFWKFKSQPEGFIFFHSRSFYELNFSGHALSSFPFYSSLQNPPLLHVHGISLKKLKALFKESLSEYQGSEPYREMKIANFINAIYIELARSYSSNIDMHQLVSYKYAALLEQLQGLINIHFYLEKFPKFYANQLNITPKHLNRIVRDTINKTTQQLISERVILEAQRLIVHTADPLSQIAYTLGFSDYAYFSKLFKLKTGMSPMEFRNQYTGAIS
ncbi:MULTISPECIES: helix-turn-helix domain-containing protein [Flagellimonas]|uniref:Helix-turn-helix domain-containing protein n=1 Tax=Flagellimonas hadalis TaxID=2597517 RepID=A0A5N5J1G7_9FLAO|nr:helix-turn-helix domain-containing protein [Allomuricauda hadalis]KAB5486098.1 helix-turn-helix domain-containing protein [Allomuricauda hadalis]